LFISFLIDSISQKIEAQIYCMSFLHHLRKTKRLWNRFLEIWKLVYTRE